MFGGADLPTENWSGKPSTSRPKWLRMGKRPLARPVFGDRTLHSNAAYVVLPWTSVCTATHIRRFAPGELARGPCLRQSVDSANRASRNATTGHHSQNLRSGSRLSFFGAGCDARIFNASSMTAAAVGSTQALDQPGGLDSWEWQQHCAHAHEGDLPDRPPGPRLGHGCAAEAVHHTPRVFARAAE